MYDAAVPPWYDDTQIDRQKFLSDFNRLTKLANKELNLCFLENQHLFHVLRYSLLAGGKRIRPVLALSCGEMLGLDKSQVLPFAIALEFLHTASLIHDDLPPIDDDELRRGMPSCHAKFGQADAIIAGDALFVAAFGVVSTKSIIPEHVRVELISILSDAAFRLCLGQAMDISPGQEGIEKRHENKTGALLEASVLGPACFLDDKQKKQGVSTALKEYGSHLGLLFQITDDILDATSNKEALGKNTSIDTRHGRETYTSLYGLDGARQKALIARQKAEHALSKFGEEAWFLREFADYVLNREK
jgi:geranylgeranyl diphosphate synthase, type II